jgi:hypothetical protein
LTAASINRFSSADNAVCVCKLSPCDFVPAVGSFSHSHVLVNGGKWRSTPVNGGKGKRANDQTPLPNSRRAGISMTE